jgi:hypothetical protein
MNASLLTEPEPDAYLSNWTAGLLAYGLQDCQPLSRSKFPGGTLNTEYTLF